MYNECSALVPRIALFLCSTSNNLTTVEPEPADEISTYEKDNPAITGIKKTIT